MGFTLDAKTRAGRLDLEGNPVGQACNATSD
jgi:hypothetical protein